MGGEGRRSSAPGECCCIPPFGGCLPFLHSFTHCLKFPFLVQGQSEDVAHLDLLMDVGGLCVSHSSLPVGLCPIGGAGKWLLGSSQRCAFQACGSGKRADRRRRWEIAFFLSKTKAKPSNALIIQLWWCSRLCHSLSPLGMLECLFLNHGFSLNEEGWKSDK